MAELPEAASKRPLIIFARKVQVRLGFQMLCTSITVKPSPPSKLPPSPKSGSASDDGSTGIRGSHVG